MLINAPTDNISVSPDWARTPRALVEELAQFPVALIGDCQSRIGMMSAGITLQTPGLKLAGTILPILTREGDNLAIHRGLDEAQPGDVLVINANSDTNRACFGDILGEAVLARGVTGVVIDGATRDVDELAALQLPVFARGTSPAGPFKHGPGTVGHTVACGNVVCRPGDAIIGDTDGVIVVPREHVRDMLANVRAQEEIEESMRDRIRNAAAPISPEREVQNAR